MAKGLVKLPPQRLLTYPPFVFKMILFFLNWIFCPSFDRLTSVLDPRGYDSVHGLNSMVVRFSRCSRVLSRFLSLRESGVSDRFRKKAFKELSHERAMSWL